MNRTVCSRNALWGDIPILVYLALGKLFLHILFLGRYGYFRDEFYYIACSDRLAWGYVDHPPLSIFLLEIVRLLLGDSLYALRILPVIAGCAVLFLTGLMAHKLGGGRFAQVLAAIAVLAAPVVLIQSRYFSMNAFDLLFWTLAAYLVILIIKNNNPRLWLIFGIVAGLGLLNKYSIGFFCIGLFSGLMLTSHRRHLFSKWFWSAVLIAFLIFLPHILWEVRNHLPSLEFMSNAAKFKNAPVSFLGFALGQFAEIGKISSVLWLLGLCYFFFHREGKQYRFLGWSYVIIFVLMVAGNAKVYYLSPIYPMLLAAGASFLEKAVRPHSTNWLKPVALGLVVIEGIVSLPFAVPVLPVATFIRYQSFLGVTPPREEKKEMGALPQYYADMFGWEDLVATVARAYADLTPEEKSKCAIYTNNYGEAGAIDFFGQKYHLPKSISGHNNYWLWGPGGATGEVVIRQGGSIESLRQYYGEVRQAAVFKNDYCMPHENDMPIFVCKGRYVPLGTAWPSIKHFD